MKTQKKFSEITSDQNPSFKQWFGDMEYEDKKSKLYSKKLGKNMLDKDILTEYKPTELSLGEVFNYLKTDADKNEFFIFYAKDIGGILRAVHVRWDDDGWGVYWGGGWGVRAHPVEGQGKWGAGNQVLSREPFDSLVDKTLNPSDSLPNSLTINGHVYDKRK